MSWAIQFSKRSLKDARLLQRAKLWQQGELVLSILRENRFQNPPPYEKLGETKGLYSRRINKQHRVVYQVDKPTKIVFVVRMWSHYE